MATEIRPAKQLPLIWKNNDPTDTTTYYVQAVIRKTSDATVLATKNLTDEGSSRFTGSYVVPFLPDDTIIDVTVSVYTDSGYSSLSPNKPIENRDYIVRDIKMGGGGFGGGAGLSTADVRKIFSEELKKIIIPEYKDPDLSRIYEKIDSLSRQINDKPVTERTDLAPIQTALNALRSDLGKKIENIPQPDLEPIIDELGGLNQAINEATGLLKGEKSKIEELFGKVNDIMEKMRGFFFNDMDDLQRKITELSDNFKKEMSKTLVITKSNPNEDDEENS
jgi:hypothetical protein